MWCHCFINDAGSVCASTLEILSCGRVFETLSVQGAEMVSHSKWHIALNHCYGNFDFSSPCLQQKQMKKDLALLTTHLNVYMAIKIWILVTTKIHYRAVFCPCHGWMSHISCATNIELVVLFWINGIHELCNLLDVVCYVPWPLGHSFLQSLARKSFRLCWLTSVPAVWPCAPYFLCAWSHLAHLDRHMSSLGGRGSTSNRSWCFLQ